MRASKHYALNLMQTVKVNLNYYYKQNKMQ